MPRFDYTRISIIVILTLIGLSLILNWSGISILWYLSPHLTRWEPNTSFRSPEIQPNYGWPPKSWLSIRDPITGFYNVTLPVRIDPDLPTNQDEIESYVDYLYKYSSDKIQSSGGPEMSLKELVQLDQTLRVGSDFPNYMLYPQAVNVARMIDAVRRGDPIKQSPINNPELILTQIPRTVCNPHNRSNTYNLIILIKSCVFCFDERQQARQTFMRPNLWTDLSIGFVFVVGQPVFDPTTQHTFYGYSLTMKNHLPPAGMTQPQALDALKLEADKHGDLLMGSFEDTYFNLTLKQITACRWASLFCTNLTKLYLFLDHDHALIPGNLIRFVRNLPTQTQTQLVLGIPANTIMITQTAFETSPAFAPIKRYAKFVVSDDEMPWPRYPPYVFGAYYLIGSGVLQDVTIAHAFSRNFRMEDVYLGIILQKLHRYPVKLGVMNSKLAICLPGPEADRLYDWTQGRFRN